MHLLSCDREGHAATECFRASGGTCKGVDGFGWRAFGRRTRDELSARRDDNSLVRGFLRDLSFLFLLRGHCESAYQLYKNVCTFPRKRFCCNVLQKSLKEEQRSVFHVFKFPSFRFRRKETFSSFRSNGKGPGLFSPREYSALFSELFVRAHARRRHRAVFRLTRKGTFEFKGRERDLQVSQS